MVLNAWLLSAAMLHAAMNPPGNALSFNGTSQYVNIPDANSLDLTTNYTLECWFKADSFGDLRGLISKYQTDGANGYLLRLSGTELDFDQLTTSGLNLQAGQWYHVAAVNSAGTRHLYVNGVEKSISGDATTVDVNTDPVRLAVDFGNRCFAGQLDEVRIWNTARTQTEIQQGRYHTLSGSETGLVAYYQFDQTSGTTLPDVTTHANTGALVNAPVWTPSSVPVNYVLSFNGTNQDVNIGHGTSLNTGNILTIEAWVKPTKLDNRYGVFSTRKDNTAGSFQLEIGVGSGTVGSNLGRVAFTGVGTFVAETNNNVITVGQWNHIAYVRTGTGTGQQAIYVNGVAQTLLSNTSYSIIDNSSDKVIGSGTLDAQFFPGEIDDLRIWNTARTQTEIRDSMHQGLAGSETGLKAYYKFNQGGGTSLTDATANANTGTLVNTPTWSASTVPFANLVAGSTNIRGTWISNHTSLASSRLSVVNSSETGTNFAVFGHDNASDDWQPTDLPFGVAKRLTRAWRSEASGSVTGDIRIDTTGLADVGNGSLLRLLADRDGVFGNATIVAGSYSAPYFTVAAQNLPSGAYYTLALHQDLLVSDSFETAGLGGWSTQQVNATDGAWQNGSWTPTGAPPHSGDSMAVFNSWSAYPGSQTRLYRTAPFAIPASYPVATLRFWVYHDPYADNSNDRVQPQISLNGTTWVNVGAAVSPILEIPAGRRSSSI